MSARPARAARPLLSLGALVLAGLACTLPAALAAPVADPPKLRLARVTFDPVAELPALPEGLSLTSEPDSGVFVVQFTTPIRPELLARVRAAGAATLGYLPDQAYLVRLAPGAAAAVRRLAEVRWLGAVQPGWKLSPDLGTRSYADPDRRRDGRLFATADLFEGEDADAAAAGAASAGAEVLQIVRFATTARLKLHATRETLEAVARIPAVSWIEEAAEIVQRNNTSKWVVQTDVQNSVTVWDHGLRGQGEIVGHIDGRIDMNSCWFRDPVNNTPGPAHRKVVAYRSNAGLGADSHGTHTAGTSAGDQSPVSGGSTDSNGMAYLAKISHSNLNDIDGSGTQPSNLYAYLEDAHQDGARVHTNSWGDDGTTAYTTWCVDVDRFSYDYEDSLVLFAVTNLSTLRTPENAKNCLAVGASQNGLADDNHCSGGVGPTSDARRKPEIYAPGCSIVSARANTACSTSTSTGTSMASPGVTGTAALARQYYREGWYPSGAATAADSIVPSGALIKATLIDSAVDMTGVSGYPSNLEGWGRVLLENALYFQGDVRKLSVMADVRNADGMTTGGLLEYPLEVTGSGERLRVTLAYTEPPAALLASSAAINNLGLEVVSPTGILYLGNVMDTPTGLSLPGGTADPRNNVEQVILAAPQVGTWTVRVRGTAVNQGTQGFALVASGEVEPFAAAALRYVGHTVQDAAPTGNADGIADPGETFTLPVTLRNATTDPVASIVGIVSTDHPAEVKVLDETATFGTISGGTTGSTLAPHYRLSLSPTLACGSSVRVDVLTQSSVGEGTVSFQIPVGASQQSVASTTSTTIPKRSSAGISQTLQVATPFTLRDVNVFVDILHGDVGQLVVQLVSPAGTTITLHNRSRAGTANILTTYDLERQPDGPGNMTALDGQAAQGTWTLRVVDDVGGGTPAGTLRGWRLDLDSITPISCTPLVCGTPVPGEVAPDLQLVAAGADLQLAWTPLSGASSYRVWRASLPDFSDERLLGTAAGPSFVQPAGMTDGTWFYRVRAVNGCEQEGP